jgi:hypothetical protein
MNLGGRRSTRLRGELCLLVGVCLVATACTALRNKADDSGGRMTNGGGELLGLHSTEGALDQRRLRPDRFCVDAAAALSGGDVLDCQLVPQGNSASTICPDPLVEIPRPRTDRFADTARCQPLLPIVASQAVGWVLTERDRKRELSIYLGALPDRTTTTSASSAPQPTLVEKFRATDEANRWSELAVCPSDLDDDGVNELVVLTRPWDELERNPPDESARPEVVAVWLQPPTRAGGSTAPLRALAVSRPVPRSRGEGCASPVVQTLRYRDRALRVDLGDGELVPPPPGIAR